MEDTFNNPFMNSSHHQLDENDSATETGSETPPSASATKLTSTSSSPKKSSKRGLHKRVVSIPMKDVEGSRLKGGEITNNTPPSDSWAWRKYGQKPIKGSPYPRGYYKCSSSKGCPARKQVERSSVDPTMLLITYSCEHNHPGPTSRNSHAAAAKTRKLSEVIAEQKHEQKPEPEEKFTDLRDDQFSWFADMDTTSSTVWESPIFAERTSSIGDVSSDVAMFFPMGEEDESLFADLEELPECSVVFRRGGGGSGPLQRNEEQQRQMCTATPPWFGTTS